MAYSVTSWFIDQTQLKVAEPKRKFTIAGSDYSSRVVKWPSLRRAYTDIRPVNISVDLSNEDQALNFFRSEPLNLLSSCQLKMGYARAGYAVRLNGTSQYVDCGDSGSHDMVGQVTLSAWVCPRGDGTGNEIIALKQNTPGSTGASYSLVYFHSSGKFSFSMASSGSPFTDLLGVTIAELDRWYHVVGTYSSSDRRLYVNGIAEVSTTGNTGDLIIANGKFLIGYEDSWGPEYFNGDIDDVILYNTALSPSDVLNIYNGNAPGGFISRYGFDDATGTTAIDSGGASNGTLINGAQWVSGAEELLTLYSGDIDRVMYKKGALTIQTLDKFKQFTERVVGSSNSPALFTGSNYLPSDIAWWLCTSYGGLSAATSVNNPDIDYAAFNEWASVFSNDSVYIQGRFEGPKVTEALRKVARYTDSGIWVEGNKVTFARFAEAGSHETVVTADSILDLSLSIDDSTVVNKQHVYADYDVNSKYWKLDIFDVDSTSVNSYGLREEIEKDESIWYVSSATALNMAQRRVLFSAAPYQEYNLSLPLVTLPRQIGEMLRIDDDFLGVTSGEAWRIMEYSLDMNSGKMEVKADSSRIASPFILDHDVYGLLDQDYNSLL